TRTIPQRTVYTALQADLRSMMSSVQTQEQLDELRARLAQVGTASEETDRREKIQDPPTIGRKGRPPTQRITGATEGRARGGSAGIKDPFQGGADAPRRQNLCSHCRQPGHTRPRCPQ
ncbi:hypothetical protein B0H17DRAFT_872296, partial [Mycena rosella]